MAFEELSFAENFTTSTKSNLPKIVEVVQVDSVHATIKELIELRDRSTSTLTVERLVKKFCQSYENLDNQQKQDVLLHLATKHYIKENWANLSGCPKYLCTILYTVCEAMCVGNAKL